MLFGSSADSKHTCYLWTKKGEQKRTLYFSTGAGLAKAAKQAEELSADDWNVYCQTCLHDPAVAGKRGTKESARVWPGLWADIDFGTHKSRKDYPPDLDAALALVGEFDLSPTIVIHSGNGLHVYWLLRQAMDLGDLSNHTIATTLLNRSYATLKKLADGHGWQLDNVMELARVLRIPGTRNIKDGFENTNVRILRHDDDARYTIEELDAALLPDEPPLESPLRVVEQPQVRRQPSEHVHSEQSQRPNGFPGTDTELIALAKKAKNGAKFQALWKGDISDYPSESEADLALMNLLAFWTGRDAARMGLLFNQSGLGARGKWQDREDYRTSTINIALKGTTESYTPLSSSHIVIKGGEPLATSQKTTLPTIRTNGRQLRDTSDEAFTALKANNDPPVMFVRGGKLSRIGTNEHDQAVIERLEEASLRGLLTRAADFCTEKITKEKTVVTSVSPPHDVVQDIHSLGEWPLVPALLSIVNSPVIREDGSMLIQPGYDAATKLYYQPHTGFVLPTIPDQPSKKDVVAALGFVLDELFVDFPFVSIADRTNMMGCLLTPIVRAAIPGSVPLCLLDKPTPGSGASLLSDIVAMIATGEPGAKALIPEGRGSEDEWRKKITSLLLDGQAITIWDNVDESISSSALSSALTSSTWSDRILGKDKWVRLPVRTTWIATANNIQLRGDLARRAYRVRIDANEERPWARDNFRHADLMGWTKQHRGELLAALLTMARGWFVADKPRATTPKMGSFDDWTRVVGGILEYAGMQDFLGNLEELYLEVDEDGPQWAAFLAAWFEEWGPTTRAIGDFVTLASPKLKDAIPESVEYDADKLPSSRIKLGKAFKKRAGRIYTGFKLVRNTDGHTKGARWSVKEEAPR